MNISQHGLDFIAGFEGGESSDGRFHAYWDPWGKVWTIGFGETSNVRPGMVWSRTQAEAELMKSLEARYEPAINALGVPLNQNQYDALCSFAWNCGPGSMQWDVGRYLRQRNYKAAAQAMLQYDRSGGVVLAGLQRRRAAERALFLAPVPGPSDPNHNHYELYPNVLMTYDGQKFHERELAQELDGFLKHPLLHRHGLKHDLPLAVAARKRVWVVSVMEPPDFKHPRAHADWKGSDRGSRYQWWTVRTHRVEKALGIPLH